MEGGRERGVGVERKIEWRRGEQKGKVGMKREGNEEREKRREEMSGGGEI